MMYLVTGYSGFLGKQILSDLGIGVCTLGRSENALIVCDLSKQIPQIDVKISRVIHVAGRAHTIPKTQSEKDEFFRVNLTGTLNLLKGLEGKQIQQFVLISSVSVLDELPRSSYSQSKWEAESAVLDWCKQKNTNALILRLPLIWGENAQGNLGAMEKAIKNGYYFSFGEGNAVRSMVDIKEVSTFIARLKGCESGVFTLVSFHRSYKEVESIFAQKYKKRIKRMPGWLVKIAAKLGDKVTGFPINSYRLNKLETSLTFDDSDARQVLGWGNSELLKD
jgi:nucleoside-diphosphate-sugar epimerase